MSELGYFLLGVLAMFVVGSGISMLRAFLNRKPEEAKVPPITLSVGDKIRIPQGDYLFLEGFITSTAVSNAEEKKIGLGFRPENNTTSIWLSYYKPGIVLLEKASKREISSEAEMVCKIISDLLFEAESLETIRAQGWTPLIDEVKKLLKQEKKSLKQEKSA